MRHRSWQYQTGNNQSTYQKNKEESNIIFLGINTTQNKNQ